MPILWKIYILLLLPTGRYDVFPYFPVKLTENCGQYVIDIGGFSYQFSRGVKKMTITEILGFKSWKILNDFRFELKVLSDSTSFLHFWVGQIKFHRHLQEIEIGISLEFLTKSSTHCKLNRSAPLCWTSKSILKISMNIQVLKIQKVNMY